MNQVVSYRMAKKRHMCWTDEQAHCMAQVRVAFSNSEFSPRRISALKIAASRYGNRIGAAPVGRRPSTESANRATIP
ncbi:hypothetical protein WKR88_14340 [Trinickia caryophylli]|uniref:hypothetical protein n=1 Tax=Trinickia caryophylli TaxID=28094 RepID=UPI000A14C6EC|nr:hypothetical protein [Trinickia caryophylli]